MNPMQSPNVGVGGKDHGYNSKYKCANCGKTYDMHNAKNNSCPVGRKHKAGYYQFQIDKFFKGE